MEGAVQTVREIIKDRGKRMEKTDGEGVRNDLHGLFQFWLWEMGRHFRHRKED